MITQILTAAGFAAAYKVISPAGRPAATRVVKTQSISGAILASIALANKRRGRKTSVSVNVKMHRAYAKGERGVSKVWLPNGNYRYEAIGKLAERLGIVSVINNHR